MDPERTECLYSLKMDNSNDFSFVKYEERTSSLRRHMDNYIKSKNKETTLVAKSSNESKWKSALTI